MRVKIVTTAGRSHVYEIFSDGKKIGICVAPDLETALIDAIRGTTRRTSSKIDTVCDYENLTARLLGDKGDQNMLTLNTAMAAQQRSVPFGRVIVPDVGLVSFEAQRYKFGQAPLAIQTWTQLNASEPHEPFAKLTSACPRGCHVKVEDDEVIIKAYAENESLRGPLLGSGYFADTGKRIAADFASLEIWRLLPKFVDDFRRSNTHWKQFAT